MRKHKVLPFIEVRGLKGTQSSIVFPATVRGDLSRNCNNRTILQLFLLPVKQSIIFSQNENVPNDDWISLSNVKTKMPLLHPISPKVKLRKKKEKNNLWERERSKPVKRFSKYSYILSSVLTYKFCSTIHERVVNTMQLSRKYIHPSTVGAIFKKATNQSKNYIINFNLAGPSTAPPLPTTTGE